MEGGACAASLRRDSSRELLDSISSFSLKFKYMDLFFSPVSALLPRRTGFHPCWVTSSLLVGQLVSWLVSWSVSWLVG